MNRFNLGIPMIVMLFILLSGKELCAQSVLGINDDIGGGSGTGTTQVEKADDSLLYIVGGAVIVGIIVYALMKDKKENKTDDDSTQAVNYHKETFSLTNDIAQKKLNDSPDIPLNFYLGMQRQNSFLNEKNYVVGIRLTL